MQSKKSVFAISVLILIAIMASACAPTTSAATAPAAATQAPAKATDQLGIGGGENRPSGQVEVVNFLGAIARILLNLDGTPVAVDVFNERQLELPRAGQPHTVSFSSHACWVMEKM